MASFFRKAIVTVTSRAAMSAAIIAMAMAVVLAYVSQRPDANPLDALILLGVVVIVVSGMASAIGGITNYLKPDVNFKTDYYRTAPEIELPRSEAVHPLPRISSEEIKAEVIANLSEDTLSKVAQELATKYSPTVSDKLYADAINKIGGDMRTRLFQEVNALGKRANFNLIIGAAISAAGLALMGYFIQRTAQELVEGVVISNAAFRFVSRLSLVVLVQIFAFFFLRLYRYSLFEIKYFQNELTNVEFKTMALLSALHSGDKRVVGSTILEMAKTERNFILRKGESTVGLRRDELESNIELGLLSKIERVLQRQPTKAKTGS